jgi:hypothetical protein
MVTATTDTITSAKLDAAANFARLTAKGSISAHFPTHNASVITAFHKFRDYPVISTKASRSPCHFDRSDAQHRGAEKSIKKVAISLVSYSRRSCHFDRAKRVEKSVKPGTVFLSHSRAAPVISTERSEWRNLSNQVPSFYPILAPFTKCCTGATDTITMAAITSIRVTAANNLRRL